MVFRFEGFRLDAEHGTLEDEAGTVHLRAKSMETLIFLVRNRDRVLSKSDILTAVWSDAAVEEPVLFQSINDIRKALGSPNCIRTLPKRGYQWAFETEEENGKPKGRGFWSGVLVFGFLLLSAAFLFWDRDTKSPENKVELTGTLLAVLPFENLTGSAAHDWVRLGLMDVVARGLADMDHVLVLPTASTLAALPDSGLSSTDLSVLREHLQVDFLLKVDVRIQEPGFRAGIALWGAEDRVAWDVSATQWAELEQRILEKVGRFLGRSSGDQNRDSFSIEAMAQAMQYVNSGLTEKAMPYLQVLHDRHPDDVQILEELGYGYLALSAFDSVATMVAEMRRVGDSDTARGRALLLESRMFFALGDLEAALIAARQALPFFSDQPSLNAMFVQENLAVILAELKRWSEMQVPLDQAEQINELIRCRISKARMDAYRARYLLAQGRQEEASQLLEQAIAGALDQQLFQMAVSFHKLFADQDDPVRGRGHLERALTLADQHHLTKTAIILRRTLAERLLVSDPARSQLLNREADQLEQAGNQG